GGLNVGTRRPDGTSDTIQFEDKNGAGVTLSKDIVYPDGTSEIINFNPDGSSDDTTYNGPDGTGIPGSKVLKLRNGANSASIQFDQSHMVFAPARVGGASTPADVTVRLLSDTSGAGVNMRLSSISPGTPGLNGVGLLGGGGLSQFFPVGTFEAYFGGLS